MIAAQVPAAAVAATARLTALLAVFADQQLGEALCQGQFPDPRRPMEQERMRQPVEHAGQPYPGVGLKVRNHNN